MSSDIKPSPPSQPLKNLFLSSQNMIFLYSLSKVFHITAVATIGELWKGESNG